ncbi:MAG: hypothetical protein QOD39_2170 [Mycobacterium sp.]|jgi:hypothetical protein|nr:hypothetical protein [Mycobacterium sp.]
MPMLLQIRGYHLPGQVWRSTDERYDNVHVGIQVGKEPATVDWISARRLVHDVPPGQTHAL